jgi:hypothetical protein
MEPGTIKIVYILVHCLFCFVCFVCIICPRMGGVLNIVLIEFVWQSLAAPVWPDWPARLLLPASVWQSLAAPVWPARLLLPASHQLPIQSCTISMAIECFSFFFNVEALLKRFYIPWLLRCTFSIDTCNHFSSYSPKLLIQHSTLKKKPSSTNFERA